MKSLTLVATVFRPVQWPTLSLRTRGVVVLHFTCTHIGFSVFFSGVPGQRHTYESRACKWVTTLEICFFFFFVRPKSTEKPPPYRIRKRSDETIFAFQQGYYLTTRRTHILYTCARFYQIFIYDRETVIVVFFFFFMVDKLRWRRVFHVSTFSGDRTQCPYSITCIAIERFSIKTSLHFFFFAFIGH